MQKALNLHKRKSRMDSDIHLVLFHIAKSAKLRLPTDKHLDTCNTDQNLRSLRFLFCEERPKNGHV